MQGTLKKWTNYAKGYLDRYFVLENGKLAYYQSARDYPDGERWCLSVHSFEVESHEGCTMRVISHSVTPPCRLFLTTQRMEDKINWMRAIRAAQHQNVPEMGGGGSCSGGRGVVSADTGYGFNDSGASDSRDEVGDEADPCASARYFRTALFGPWAAG